MSARYILQLETATQVCSAALSVQGETFAFRDIDEPNVHASQLTLLIQSLLTEAHITFADLDAVAVSRGPGSYTGLRIGMSVAKGICYATDLPLIAIDTLAAMASGFAQTNTNTTHNNALLCPMIDARRMEVYSACYNAQLDVIQPTGARIIDANTFDEVAPDTGLLLFGSGADKLATLFADHHRITVVSGIKTQPDTLVACRTKHLLLVILQT